MTFDEAVEHFENDFEFHVDKYTVVEILEDLRKEYAPTVEMTKEQYHSFKLWKYHTAGWNMTNCAEWARDEKMTATNAMQVWLHPDDIKVVDE
ncbi:hypothetical protein QMA56_01755 [Leuconostoc falkenbergense]|uniref:hypothetical protein n=1 Tax=Leuconostoc falkenbergense TaxID=2766470 RepID=UPI0024AD13B0|nr:hypothetical protein [Leuconostoc falkenbergense]MDI6666427.1 hypothetical protein [Leuconostoc falkenbergense]